MEYHGYVAGMVRCWVCKGAGLSLEGADESLSLALKGVGSKGQGVKHSPKQT